MKEEWPDLKYNPNLLIKNVFINLDLTQSGLCQQAILVFIIVLR